MIHPTKKKNTWAPGHLQRVFGGKGIADSKLLLEQGLVAGCSVLGYIEDILGIYWGYILGIYWVYIGVLWSLYWGYIGFISGL